MAFRYCTLPDTFNNSIAATKVEYRQLGKSGLRVSNPTFGGLSVGDPKWAGWIMKRSEAFMLLKGAYDRGINTWDTANVYSNGASEEIMGAVLGEFKIPRRKVVIMTKVYRVMPDIELPQDHADARKNVAYFEKEADSSKDHVNQWGLSRSAIFDSVDDSLQRLGTTYIDVLQIHRFDPHVPPEETMRALHDLVQSGKVRYLGASSMWAHELSILQHTAERLGLTQFSCVQIRYNLLYREEEREMIKYCNRTGVGIMIWEALAAGMVARPLSQHGSSPRSQALINIGEDKDKPTEADKEIIHRVHELAQRHNWPMTSVALAWLNARVTAPVIGFNSLHAMDEVLAARGRSLTAEEERYLEEPYVSKAVFGHV
ncbi:hypothetical protein PTT_08795 [Pyrenophora teres f. teres 0-1]|uniref:NADP-dependent oxidoreductase domain-containing protein n=2 Tax=Pyrenophora teres f. teres TaxID=97479 RepID=E3RKM9_PYRTT|nr:hypothetical protein PTT_08795 [Pyrenophora teres f. teres 0-1]CAE7185091.1 Aryl-alcohol dehydrogenase NADP [Pyrenophora teres f. teres]